MFELSDGFDVYTKAFLAGLEADPDITVSQWADRYRRLSSKSSAEGGPWRTDRTPYLRGIMDELSPNCPTQRIVFMKASQIGGTEVGLNWLGYIIHLSPAPTLMVQMDASMAESVSKERIAPMIQETPALRGLIAPAKDKTGNTLLVKEFRGGQLVMCGAQSPTQLRSRPIRFLFADEVSGWPEDCGGEGDPVSLAEKRTQTFFRRKIFLNSTPGTKDFCRIEKEYLASDQRRFFVPCPDCGFKQHLKWGGKNTPFGVKYDEANLSIAHYMCENCGVLIEERFKNEMLLKGEWIATAPCAPGEDKAAGFHLNSFYSPWKTWLQCAKEFEAARGDAPQLKSWVNNVAGETWAEEYQAKVGAEVLKERAELYTKAPAGALIAVCGIDVQDNRLAILTECWGEGEESWIIGYQEIFGDPARAELWKQLDDVLRTPIDHEVYGKIPISAAAIDSGGHYTAEVYQYARERKMRGVIAIRGASQKNKPILVKPTKVDINSKGGSLKAGGEVWLVGTDTAKSSIYGRLKHNEPGPGYTHFPVGLTTNFYEMLTSEKLTTRLVRGFPVREWVLPPGRRNEGLDTKVYSYAALHFLYTHYNRKTIFAQFKKKLDAGGGRTIDKKPALPSDVQAPIIKRRNSGFVGGWK